MTSVVFPLAFHGNIRDISGHRNGRLKAIRPIGRASDGHIVWECKCDCGTIVGVKSHSLVRTKKGTGTRSCGCLRRDVSSRPKGKPWNKGKTYSLPTDSGERVYKQKHSWAKAARRIKGDKCEQCGWDKARCDVHHKMQKRDGGKFTISNALVICPNCHRVIHDKGARREIHKPIQRN